MLVADDNAVNRMLVKRVVERIGGVVDLVEDGAGAVRAARATRYDLVLMDCFMPAMDGLSATRALREDPETAHLPIVAVTAGATNDYREQCYAAGMDDFVAKPFEVSELVRVIERWRHGRFGR